MTTSQYPILENVLGNLSSDEVANSIAYLKPEPNQAGDRVLAGDETIELPWNAYIVFVDLEPGVNWGHECCYLIVSTDENEVIRIAARMPPFLKDKATSYDLLWQGPQAPAWAVETKSG